MEEVVSGYAALFDSLQVMSCLIREKDSVRLTNQQTLPSKGYQGKGSLGGYSIIMHYLLISSLLSTQPFSCRSSCNYTTHTQTHTHKAALVNTCSQSLIRPFQIVSPSRLNRTDVWNSEKNEQVYNMRSI